MHFSGVSRSLTELCRKGVTEAAFHGTDCVIVIVDEVFTDFLMRLEGIKRAHVIHDLIAP